MELQLRRDCVGHDPAGVRAVGRRETRIDVLLSERSSESDRRNRTRALPVGELAGTVALPRQARLNPDQGGWAVPVRVKIEREKTEAGQAGEPCVEPLYLFVCGVSWRRHSDTTAGWELVSCVRSSGQTARIAAALLTQAEDRPVQPRVRAIDVQGKPSLPSEAGLSTSARRWL